MMRWTTHLFALSAMLLTALPGCTTQKMATDRQTDDFELGADRPPTPQTLQAMAQILALQERFDQAEFVYRRVIHDSPDFLPAYAGLAELMIRQGRLVEAAQMVADGRQRAPEDPILVNDAGMVALLRGNHDQALHEFQKADELQPGNARYRCNSALALGMMGRYDESLAAYKQVVPLPEAYYNLGVICEARKDGPAAAANFRQAYEWDRKLNPDHGTLPKPETASP